MEIEDPKQLHDLLEKYTEIVSIAVSDDAHVTWAADAQGNQIKIDVRKGERIQYTEIPVDKSLPFYKI